MQFLAYLTGTALLLLSLSLLAYAWWTEDHLGHKTDALIWRSLFIAGTPIRFSASVLRQLAACLQYVGRLATMALLAGTLLVLANEVVQILGYGALLKGPTYESWLTLFSKPVAWAAATTIVGATVALANLRKYDIDSEAAMDRKIDRALARSKEREEQKAAMRAKLEAARQPAD